MPVLAIKKIKDFLTGAGPSTREAIVAAVVEPGLRADRVEAAIDRRHARGKLSKVGDNYDNV